MSYTRKKKTEARCYVPSVIMFQAYASQISHVHYESIRLIPIVSTNIILHNVDHQTRQYVQAEKHHDQIEQILLRHCHEILVHSPMVSCPT